MTRALALVLALFVISCQSAPRTDGSAFASPEDVIEHVRACEAEEEYGAVLNALPPDSRELTVYLTWYGVAYTSIASGEEATAEYQDILATYGLDPSYLNSGADGLAQVAELASASLEGVDLASLFQDLVTFQVSNGRFSVAFGFLEELGSVEVDADHAIATIGGKPFAFVREGGTWYWIYLDLEQDS